MTTDKHNRNKHLKLTRWLKDNVLEVPEPAKILLHRFKVDWLQWSAAFMVKFDDFELEQPIYSALDSNGWTKFHLPSFTSPLDVPASYSSVKLTDNTQQALNEALRNTFPRLTPLGRDRDTGIETTFFSPLEARISKRDMRATKHQVNAGYAITVWLSKT